MGRAILFPLLILSAILSACSSPPPPPPPPASSIQDQMTPVSRADVDRYAMIFEEACLKTMPDFVNAPRVLEASGYKGIDAENAFDGTSVASVKPGQSCFVDFKWQDRDVLFAIVTDMAERSDQAFKPIPGQRALAGVLPGGEQALLIGTRSSKSDISSFGVTLTGR